MDLLFSILAEGQGSVLGGTLRGALIGGVIGLGAGAVVALVKKKKAKNDSIPGPK